MWICLIRDLTGQLFFFFFLITGPRGSLKRLWLAGGQCCMAQVIVPCCQRLPGPAGSQTVWVSDILLSPSTRFLGRQRIFKHILKIFVNLKGSKYLSRLESLTTKSSNKPKKQKKRGRKLQRDLYGRVISTWISTHVQMWRFDYGPAMTCLRHRPSKHPKLFGHVTDYQALYWDLNTNFDLSDSL